MRPRREQRVRPCLRHALRVAREHATGPTRSGGGSESRWRRYGTPPRGDASVHSFCLRPWISRPCPRWSFTRIPIYPGALFAHGISDSSLSKILCDPDHVARTLRQIAVEVSRHRNLGKGIHLRHLGPFPLHEFPHTQRKARGNGIIGGAGGRHASSFDSRVDDHITDAKLRLTGLWGPFERAREGIMHHIPVIELRAQHEPGDHHQIEPRAEVVLIPELIPPVVFERVPITG